MKTEIEYPVIWEGRKFKSINRFDCIVVSLKREYKGCAGYMTTIPISSKEFRDENPTRASVLITEEDGWTVFGIHSDYGNYSEMKIHNSLAKEIENAKQAAKDHNLL